MVLYLIFLYEHCHTALRTGRCHAGAYEDKKLDYPWSCTLSSHLGSLQSVCEILLTWKGNFFTDPSGIKQNLVSLLSYICVAQIALLSDVILFNVLPSFLRKQGLCKQAVGSPSPNNFQTHCSLSIKFDRDLNNIKSWDVLCKSTALIQEKQIQLSPFERESNNQQTENTPCLTREGISARARGR